MSLAAVSRMEARLLLSTYERQPILFERGRGVYLWDADGKRYLDFLSGIGVNALGHSHPAVIATIRRQAGRLLHISNLFFHEYQAELARLLTRISRLDRAFFCNSGTEAWEGALKIARAFAQHQVKNVRQEQKNGGRATAKTRILAMENSFHGRTFGALTTTGQPKYRSPFVPLLPGVTFVKFNDFDDLKNKFDATVCAVCIETIQGEGGVCPVAPEFLELASRLTKEGGALLLLDEVQCGLGRTGRHFGYQHYGVLPDVVTVAKPLACGLPLGAILTTERVAACMHPGMHGTTFGGGPLACAVAIEFLRHEGKLLPHIREMGNYFRASLNKLAEKHTSVVDVRGAGLMLALELDDAELAKAVTRQLLEQRIIINRTHENVLRFLPPYVINKTHVDQVIKALDVALHDNEDSIQSEAPKKEKVTSRRRKAAHAHA